MTSRSRVRFERRLLLNRRDGYSGQRVAHRHTAEVELEHLAMLNGVLELKVGVRGRSHRAAPRRRWLSGSPDSLFSRHEADPMAVPQAAQYTTTNRMNASDWLCPCASTIR